jgi:hypothetical protein
MADDLAKALEAVELVQAEADRRARGLAHDPRFDPAFDYLADLDDSLTRDPYPPRPDAVDLPWPP